MDVWIKPKCRIFTKRTSGEDEILGYSPIYCFCKLLQDVATRNVWDICLQTEICLKSACNQKDFSHYHSLDRKLLCDALCGEVDFISTTSSSGYFVIFGDSIAKVWGRGCPFKRLDVRCGERCGVNFLWRKTKCGDFKSFLIEIVFNCGKSENWLIVLFTAS